MIFAYYLPMEIEKKTPGIRIVSVSNRKGGSGKTTTAVNLAAALAHKGKRVLLVDCDPQGHSALSLGKSIQPGEVGLYSLLTNKVSFDQATRKTYLSRLSLLPGGRQLSLFEKNHAADTTKRFILANKLQEVGHNFDYTIIDTPPTVSLLTVSALIASSHVLVPMQAHYLAMEGLAEMVKLISRINEIYKRALKLIGVVPTFYNPQSRLGNAIVRQIKNSLGESIILHPIRTNVALAEAPSHGKTIFQYKLKSNGAYDYLSLANQVEALK